MKGRKMGVGIDTLNFHLESWDTETGTRYKSRDQQSHEVQV